MSSRLLLKTSSTSFSHLQGEGEYQESTDETEPRVARIRRASEDGRLSAGARAVASGNRSGAERRGWCRGSVSWSGCDDSWGGGGLPRAVAVPVVAVRLAADGLGWARLYAGAGARGVVGVVVVAIVFWRSGGGDDGGSGGWGDGCDCWGGGDGDGALAMPVCRGQLKWAVEMREIDVDIPVVAMRLTAV